MSKIYVFIGIRVKTGFQRDDRTLDWIYYFNFKIPIMFTSVDSMIILVYLEKLLVTNNFVWFSMCLF